MYSRNRPYGFAQRTRRNLDYIHEVARKHPAQVHEVTQIVNSLLGLIVFPWGKTLKSKMEKTPLDKENWHQWEFILGNSPDLYDLIRHLRNGICHGLVEFSSDDLDAALVTLKISDRPHDDKPINWAVSIVAADMHAFCNKFIEFVEPTLKSN